MRAALAALVPFIGTLMVWGPISLWLLLSGQIVSGLVLSQHAMADYVPVF
jgi:predicted PurR-regulated permease PerM